MHGLVEACRDLPLVVKLMVPSCVPALPFENAGSVIDAGQTQALLEQPEFFGLGEMMNVPMEMNCIIVDEGVGQGARRLADMRHLDLGDGGLRVGGLDGILLYREHRGADGGGGAATASGASSRSRS